MTATKPETGDAELVRAVLAGNREAFDPLVERYFGMVYMIAYARLSNREAAEDLAQEVFLRAYLHLNRLAPAGCFPAWISRIARNLAIDWLRRDQYASRVVPTVPLDDVGDKIRDERAKGAREIVEADEQHRAVHDAMTKLSPEWRELLLLHFFEGLSKRQIARRLGLHATTVGRQIDKAMATMKISLEPIVRELAPTVQPPTGAVARVTTLIAAVTLTSAAERAALAEATAGTVQLASASLAPSGGVGGIAQLTTMLTAAVKGLSAMSMKAKVAAAVAAVALAIGGYLVGQGVLGAGNASPKAAPREFPLEFTTLPSSGEASSRVVGYSLGLETAKPASLTSEPTPVSRYPLYSTSGHIHRLLTGEELIFRLDESGGTGKGYDRLIVDLNNNGNLTDDAVYEASWQEVSRPGIKDGIFFGPIDAPADKVKGKWRPRMQVIAAIEKVDKAGSTDYVGKLYCDSLSYAETTVEIGGNRERIRITDANGNMRLGDTAVVEVYESEGREYWDVRTGDFFCRDRNDNGEFENHTIYDEREPLCPLVYFGPDPYTLTVTEDGASIRIEPYRGPVGELAVSNHNFVENLVLVRETAPGRWEALRPQWNEQSGTFKAPPGAYYLSSCLTRYKDSSHRAGCSGWKRKEGTPVRLEANTTATLVCGAPLQVQAFATKSSPSRVDISAEVTGAAGESYMLSFFRRADERGITDPIVPHYRIVEEGGGEIDSGEFRVRGPFIVTPHPWEVPKQLAGKKIRIFVDLDLGELETVCKPAELQL